MIVYLPPFSAGEIPTLLIYIPLAWKMYPFRASLYSPLQGIRPSGPVLRLIHICCFITLFRRHSPPWHTELSQFKLWNSDCSKTNQIIFQEFGRSAINGEFLFGCWYIYWTLSYWFFTKKAIISLTTQILDGWWTARDAIFSFNSTQNNVRSIFYVLYFKWTFLLSGKPRELNNKLNRSKSLLCNCQSNVATSVGNETMARIISQCAWFWKLLKALKLIMKDFIATLSRQLSGCRSIRRCLFWRKFFNLFLQYNFIDSIH